MLLGAEERGLDTPEDQRVIAEQLLTRDREAVHKLGAVVHTLPIELIGRRPQHRDEAHVLVFANGAADKLVLPAGLALDIEDAALATRHIDYTHLRVVS